MDFNDLEMTQVISVPDDSDDDMDREIRAVLKLHDQDAPAAFQTFNLKPGPNMVGRSRTCDVIIENYAVSKQHAVINVGGHSCTIMDLGSQNKVKIGKRTLKPNCQYNLDYGEEFTIAGLRARVLCDQNNGTNNDTGSDTCSESLLTAIEVALDQEGVDIKTLAGCDTNEKLDLPSAASERGVGAADAAATSVDVSDHQAAEKSQDSKAHSNEHQSSGSFNLPDMPNLDYTQTDSEQGTEPYMGAGHEPEKSQEGAGTVVQAAKVPESDDTPSAKDARTCTSTQPYSDDAGDGNPRDARKFAAADEESRLNAETQPYAERPEVPLESLGEGVDAAADEMERLNAPTQAYGDDASAEAERLNAPTQAYTDQDDVERLNAATQPYAADVGMDDEERLNAVTQPYAMDNCDEEEKLNAVTQPYTVSVSDDEGRLNAVTQPYTAADISQSEHERMNDVTHSFNEEEDDIGKDSVCAPTQPGERHRRLLTGPSELSFVLCEASQPCREEEEDDDEEFCAPTQKDESPPLKVHALLKHRRERGPAVEDDDKTPPLSPKTTVDETPPPSPGIVPESDPEDNGDTSMVTARHSLPLLDATSATVYEDCVTPGNGVSSPVIGMVSGRRQRRGLSLKKPTYDTVPELPSQESTAGAEWMQQQQDSSQSKASRKLAYVTEVGKDNDLDSRAADAPLAEPLVSGVERTDGHFAAIGSLPSIPVKPQESIDANKSTSAEYSEMPLLHMSEDMDLDAAATDKEDSTAYDTAVEEKGPAEACASSEITASTGRPSDDRTVSKDGCTEEQEETFEKDEPTNPSFENKTSRASPREEGSADTRTVPEQADEEEEQAIKKDEPANDSSESEEESGRGTRRRGRKKPLARAKRYTKKAASTNDAKKAPVENNTVPARRSSGRQNAGSRMKSLLSLEKRTSASGAFKESELSQEVNDEQSAREDASAKEPHEKAGRPRTRRGAKGKAAAKEDELEVAPHHPSESLPSEKESEVGSSSDGGNNKDPSVKPGEDDTEGKAEAGDSTQVDDNKECQPKAGPSGHQEDVNAEDAVITASLTPSLGDCDVSCTNATIDTCFSEPFPSFSEVMAECQPYIRDTEAQDEKNEPAEEQENTAAEPASKSKATAPAVSEPEPAVKEPPRALRSKQPKEGVATRNRKAPKVDEELPITRRKATRGTREEPLAEAEPLAKDPASSVEQPKAPQLASPQPSNRAKRGRPYRTAAGRKAVPSVANVVPKIAEDVEESEGETEQDTAEDRTSSIQQSEAKQSAAPQVSSRARRGRPFRHEAGRKAEPRISDKIVEDVEQSEGETDPDFAEDRLSGIEQPEGAQSAALQQSSRARRGCPFHSAIDRKAVPSITAIKVTEDTEQSEGERNTDHLSAQETESIEGTLSEGSQCSTSSRKKTVPSTEVLKATRRGARRLLQLKAKRGSEEASSESDTEHLSAQDTESIHGTPLNSSETLLSESEALPRAPAPRKAKNARLSLQHGKEQADQAASEGPTAESTEEPSQNVRPQRRRTSAKTRPEREGEASYVATADDSLECVELSQSPRTSKHKRGAKQSQEKDGPFVQSALNDSTMSLQTEAHSQTSLSSQRGRRNAKKPETQDSLATEGTQGGPPFLSTLDDSTQSLPTESQLQSSRGSQRGRRDSKQLEMQDLSPKETEGAHVENALDDSTQSLSVESHSKTSQGAQQGKRNAKKPKTRNLTPEGTDDVPPVQSALDDSTQSLSMECQSQNSRSSRQGRRNAKQPETLNSATPEGTEVQTEEEAHDAKSSKRGRKALKLSSEAGSRTAASAGENNITSADHEPEIRRTRRGGDTVEPSSQNEQVRLTLETAGRVEPFEKTDAEVEPHSVPPRRGRKAAKQTRKRGGSKNVPEDDAVTETFEAPGPANLKSSKAPRTTNLSLPKPTADTEVLIEVESPSPRTSQRSSVKTVQIPSEDIEQRNNGDPAKVSSRSKRKVTKVGTAEDVTVEAETEARSSESASQSPTCRMPAPPTPVTRKRDARRAGRKDNLLQATTASVLETSAETSPQCPMQRVSRKRPVASMSFGEARHESDDEAADNEQETLDEVVVKPGPKSRRKELVKEAVVKQEVVEKSPAKRGKRKADIPEAKTEVPQEVKSRRDEQAHSSPAPKKTAKVKPKVLFTGIDDTKTEEQVVRDLGGIIATNPSACTHLVTDKFRRTVKALCCIGKGTPIVDVAWIKKCREAGAFVDHIPHMLLDKKAEKALNFNLRDTLTKASTGGVLRGWNIHATAHVLPSPSDMKEIVACAGGKYLDNLPARTSTGTTVVISCKQDLKACARARNNGIPVVAAEFILSGLLQHSLDLDAHRLE